MLVILFASVSGCRLVLITLFESVFGYRLVLIALFDSVFGCRLVLITVFASVSGCRLVLMPLPVCLAVGQCFFFFLAFAVYTIKAAREMNDVVFSSSCLQP